MACKVAVETISCLIMISMIYRKKITLMKIFKVMRSSQSQLEYLPSYFYKNVLFGLSKRTDDEEWRGKQSLRDR